MFACVDDGLTLIARSQAVPRIRREQVQYAAAYATSCAALLETLL